MCPGPARSQLPAGHRQQLLALTSRTRTLKHPALVKAFPPWSCSEARGQCHYPEDKPWLPSLTSASAGCFILAKLLGSRGPGAPVSWQLGSAQHLCGQVNPPFPSRLPPPPFPKEAAGRRLRLEPSVPTRPTDLQRVLASLPPAHIFPADSSRNSHFFSFLKLSAVSWNTCNSPRS